MTHENQCELIKMAATGSHFSLHVLQTGISTPRVDASINPDGVNKVPTPTALLLINAFTTIQ
jgi:hypothetical protein